MKTILLVLVLLISVTATPKDIAFGELLFPCKGNIDFDEGTYEVWFCLNYSFSESMNKDTSFIQPMTFLQMISQFGWVLNNLESNSKTDKRSGISYRLIASQARNLHGLGFSSNIFLKTLKDGSTMKGNIVVMGVEDTDMDWKKGEWHYMAISWKKNDSGYEATLVIDDNIPKTMQFKLNTKIDTRNNYDNYIRVGNRDASWSTINSFRISKRLRTLEEMKTSYQNGLKADDATLLYHDGSTVGKLKKIRIKRDKNGKWKGGSKKIKIGKKGAIHGSFKIVNGKFGKAIKLIVK